MCICMSICMFIVHMHVHMHVHVHAHSCSCSGFLATPFFCLIWNKIFDPLPLLVNASFSKPCCTCKIQTFGHLMHHLFEELRFLELWLLVLRLSFEPLERSSEPFWFPSEPWFQSNPLVLSPTFWFILIRFRYKLWYLNKIESWLSMYFVWK